jgi:hypothetical protein
VHGVPYSGLVGGHDGQPEFLGQFVPKLNQERTRLLTPGVREDGAQRPPALSTQKPENGFGSTHMSDQYDPTLDATTPIGTIPLGKVRIEVTLHRYNGGKPKVQAMKCGTKKNGDTWRTLDLGRLDIPTALVLAELFKKAAERAALADFELSTEARSP